MIFKFCIFLFLICQLFSMPTKEHVIHGKLDMAVENKELTINQTSKKSIVEWGDFSISEKERVNIHQLFSDGIILNRVIGENPSKILGTLESNGTVYLINEQGILIGKEGEIQAKGFLASCLNIKNEPFLSGKTLFFEGDKQSHLVNLGTIVTSGESLFCFAQIVKNEGQIIAKENAYLVGSNQIYLTEDRQIFVGSESVGSLENKGSIKAIKAHLEAAGGSVYNLAINLDGEVEANGVERSEGKIILKAHSNLTDISGSMTAQTEDKGGCIHVTGGDEIYIHDQASLSTSGQKGGGEILIGGDYQGKNSDFKNTKNIWINKKAKIQADAIQEGNGGKVIVWADEQNLFGGTISAKGGIEKGDGGFVEVSAKEYLLYKGQTFTNAPNGVTGTLFIDPSDITISNSASSPAFPTSPGNYNPAVASATLNVSDLVNVVDGLGNNNVTISTSAGSGGTGIVTFSSDVTWSANTTLTVLADLIRTLGGTTLSNTSTASNFTAFDFRANEDGTSTNDSSVLLLGTISTVNGNVNLLGNASTNRFGVQFSTLGKVISTGTGVNAGTITLNGTGGADFNNNMGVIFSAPVAGDVKISSVDGDILITGQGGVSATTSGNRGIQMELGSIIESTGTTSDAATITLNGTGGTALTDNQGIRMRDDTFIRSVNGDISLTGVGGGTSTSNEGIIIDSSALVGTSAIIESTGTTADAANITLNGTGAGTGGSGVEITTRAGVRSVSGDISITGSGVGSEQGLDMTSADAFVGNGSTEGDITINANTVNLTGTVQSTGTLVIQPNTVGSTIGIGTGSSGTLNLLNTELTNIQDGFSEIIFGRTDGTGAIDVRAFTYSDPITIRSLSGTITVNGALAAGANAITLISDSMSILSSVTGTDTLTIEPAQTTTTIGLGDTATGTLNLTSTEIGNFTDGFSSITFGKTTQDSTVDMESVTYNDPIVVYGKQIDVDGAISSGSNNVTLNIGPASSGTFNLNALVTTSGAFAVNGGSSNDAFNINVAGQTAVLNGSSGTNTLTAPNAVNTWTITADNAGTLDSVSFSNMQNLIGNSSTDSFTFNGAFQVSGSIDGSTGSNTVTGPNVTNTWAITADDTGTLTPTGATGATSLSNITNLTGGSSSDVFTFDGAFQISGSINGGSGSNTINGPNVNNTWAVASETTGTLTPTGASGPTSYTNVSSLVGNDADDTFNLSPDITLPSMTAGAGSDTLTFLAGWTIPATVNLNTIIGFETINGPPGLGNTLVGNNLNNTWTITAANAGTVANSSSTVAFTNFPNLTGGSENDTFDFTGGFLVTSLNGSSGTNTLLAPNTANIWNITSTNAGTVAGMTFTSITDLTGGSLSDDFVFADQQGITGRIDGGAPASLNTLDYSNFSSPAIIETFTSTSGTASNLGNGYINIGNIIGNAAIIDDSVREKSRFYFTNLQLLFTELYHNRLIPDFFIRQFEKMKYVPEIEPALEIK